MRKWISAICLMLLVLGFCSMASAGERILVFGAASMKDALEAAGRVYQEQIAAGAPADVYISANSQWADWLDKREMVLRGSRRNIATNKIVIAGIPAKDGTQGPEQLLTGGRFAMGDPSHVPAGRYGREALKSLGIWEKVRQHAVRTCVSRLSMSYVEKLAWRSFTVRI
jgi:molybdate transport system substrate-binding protein